MGENPSGYFCEKEPAKTLVEDVRILKNMVRAEYPNVPCVLFGHSMGSFITRNFVHSYSGEIDGAIISGTGMLPKALVIAMKAMVEVLLRVKGSYYKSAFVDKMAFGSYLDRIENPKTGYDWLSTDEERVQAYVDDSLCGFSFTLNGFKGMAGLMLGLFDKAKIGMIDKAFPMHFIYGEEDPVGDYGKSAFASCRMYADAGMKRVSNKAYPGKRHELLHEDIRESVMEDIYSWLKKEMKI